MGGPSGSLFGSQRSIKANKKMDVGELKQCSCLLLSIVKEDIFNDISIFKSYPHETNCL
jgi:hypothetical protein